MNSRSKSKKKYRSTPRRSDSIENNNNNDIQSSTSEEQNDFLPSNSPIFTIKTSKVMGRYMVSKEVLKPGDLILREEPLVVGPCAGCKVQCLGCYKVLEAPTDCVRCSKCAWPLCSNNCPSLYKKHGHTEEECSALTETKSSRFLDYDDFEKLRSYFNIVVPLRCLLLKKNDPDKYSQLMAMETHNDIRIKIPELWQTNQETIVNKIHDELELKEFEECDIHSICGILEVNSFEVGQQGVTVRALYPTAFLMSHDCVPNTNHSDEENFQLTVRASTEIEIEQPITLSYAYTLQSTHKRREHILENKFFECHCNRCSDPTELGTHMSSLICPKCHNYVLSTNPLDPNAHWSCSNSKNCAGYKIKAEGVQLLIDRVSSELENVDSNDIKGFENFLNKYRNVLHPTHYLCIQAKLSLSQLYGKIDGYLIEELDEKFLLRKQQLCEEILKIFNKIEPGYTKIRGVTLYEMHAPLMILLSRKFESNNVSKAQLRYTLKRVLRCLEESNKILCFEPPLSSEGAMGEAAKCALLRMHDWEKILGKLR